jgi:hypothetical protein
MNTGVKDKTYLGGTQIRAASALHPFKATPLLKREIRRVNPVTGMPFRETGELRIQAS